MVDFPKYDVRKTIDNQWNMEYEAGESITIPASPDYVVKLKEVPDDGTQETRPQISGLTETLDYPPSTGEFYVNYGNGKIVFNEAQAGQTFSVAYWKKGSLVTAEDINFLYDRVPSGGASSWDDLTDKPSPVITLSGDVTGSGVMTELGSVEIQTTLNLVLPSGGELVYWESVLNKPLTFPPDAHNQAWSTITDTPSAFTPEDHTHTVFNNDLQVDDLIIPVWDGNGSTFKSLNDYFKVFGSVGKITGGNVIDGGSNTVNVSGGTGVIRIENDQHGQVKFFNWNDTLNVAIAPDTVRWVGIEYNSGNPQVVVKDEYDWDFSTAFSLAKVTNEIINGTPTMSILTNPWYVANGITNVIERIRSYGRLKRDEAYAGLEISVTGTRNFACSEGRIWSRLNKYIFSTIDTSVSGSFKYMWKSSTNGWQSSNTAQYSVIQYNDTTKATLQNLDNNQYACVWVYALVSDLSFVLLYPQHQYNKSVTAETENPPTNVPDIVAQNAMLIGRIIIQEGVDVPVAVQSVFEHTFSTTSTDHGNLTGLLDRDHPAYAIYTDVTNFNGKLSPSASDVQLALDMLDDHNHAWEEITNKPLTFPPESHNQAWSTITDTPSSFTPSSHSHGNADITDVAWGKLTGIPDSTITLTGAATGTGTMTDLGNVSINVGVAHPMLSDLLQDDHTQYALLNGRLGQTLKLTTLQAYDSNGLLIKDDGGNLGITIADGGNVGIGTSPDVKFHIINTIDPINASSTGLQKPTILSNKEIITVSGSSDVSGGYKYGAADGIECYLTNTSANWNLLGFMGQSVYVEKNTTGIVGLVYGSKISVYNTKSGIAETHAIHTQAWHISDSQLSGINVAAWIDSKMQTSHVGTSTVSTNTGIHAQATANSLINGNILNLDNLVGIQSFLTMATASGGVATATNAIGLAVEFGANGSNVVMTNAYGLRILDNSSFGTFGTFYGVYIGSITHASTAAWGIYQSDANNSNYFAGKVGIGISPTFKLQIEDAIALLGSAQNIKSIYNHTVVSGNTASGTAANYGIYTFIESNGTQSGSGKNLVAGSYGMVKSLAGSQHNCLVGAVGDVEHYGGNTLPVAYGVEAWVGSSGNSTITKAIGVYSGIEPYDSGCTMTNAYCYYAEASNFGVAGAVIENAYAFYIDAFNATNMWGIYQTGANVKNYFAGNVGIGIDTPVSKLNTSLTYNPAGITSADGNLPTRINQFNNTILDGAGDLSTSYVYGSGNSFYSKFESTGGNYSKLLYSGIHNNLDIYNNNLYVAFGTSSIIRYYGNGSVAFYGYATTNNSTHFGSGNVSTLIGSFNVTGVSNANIGTTSGAAGIYGASCQATGNASVASTVNITTAYGGFFVAGGQANAAGTGIVNITTAYGIYSRVVARYTGVTVTNAYGLYVENGWANNNTGAITNQYGIYVEAQTLGITNAYSLYVAGGNSYFGGNVGIGVSPSVALCVEGTTLDTIRIGQTSTVAGNYFMSIGVDTTYNIAFFSFAQYAVQYRPIVFNPFGGNVGIGTGWNVPRNGLEIATLDSNYITSLRIGGITGGDTSVVLGAETSRHQILFSSWRDVQTDTVGAKIVAINKNVYLDYNALVQNTDLAFFTLSTTPSNTDGTTEKMRITSTGNVGIGTPSPTTLLEVNRGTLDPVLITGATQYTATVTNKYSSCILDGSTDVKTTNYYGTHQFNYTKIQNTANDYTKLGIQSFTNVTENYNPKLNVVYNTFNIVRDYAAGNVSGSRYGMLNSSYIYGYGTWGSNYALYNMGYISNLNAGAAVTVTNNYGTLSYSYQYANATGASITVTNSYGIAGIAVSYGRAAGDSTVTVTNAYGVYAQAYTRYTGAVITNAYGLYVPNGNPSYNTGTTQNQCGVYIEEQTCGTNSKWGIYVAGGYNQINSHLGIGTGVNYGGLDINRPFWTTWNSASVPASNAGGGLYIAWNFDQGAADVDFWNVYENAGTAFNFFQKTGASTYTRLLTIYGTGVVRFANTVWHGSLDTVSRFYFAPSGRSYYGSADGHEWRNSWDTTIGVLSNAGNLNVPSLTVGANSELGDFVMFADTFDGTTINGRDWITTGANTTNPGGYISSTGASNWTGNGLTSVKCYRRTESLTLTADIACGTSGIFMVGFSYETAMNYTNMPHALYFANDNLIYIYENGNNILGGGASTGYVYSNNTVYRIKIVCSSVGAKYFISGDGGMNWTHIGNSTGGAIVNSPLYIRFVSYSGTNSLDTISLSNGRDVFSKGQVFANRISIGDDRINIAVAATPANAGATGNKGDITWDASYIYVCTANNTWKRATLNSW